MSKFPYIFSFLDYNHKDKLILPVPPSDVRISYGKMVETVNLINLGEVDFHTGTKLTEISFSSFLPKYYDPAYCCIQDIPEPRDALEKILKWVSKREPVVFSITNTPIRDVFNIINIDYFYKGGSVGEIDFEIHLRRHRGVKVYKVGEATPTPTTQTTRVNTKKPPKTYTVKKGDTLSIIAQKVYGDSKRWIDIYNANKSKIGNNPNKLKEGLVLVIP